MIAQPFLVILRSLIRDTFRQARASGIGAMMLAVTAVCSFLCLSVQISGDVSLHDKDETVYFLPSPDARPSPSPDLSKQAKSILEIDPEKAKGDGVETVRGRFTLAFGAISFPMTRERGDAVRFLETILSVGVAGTFGLLMTLIWTAGFVPTFLEPSAASVMLAKPATRTQLILAKYLSVVAFVGFHVAIFVSLTWLGLGVRTQIWDARYFWSIPLLLLQFAIFYSFSILVAVMFRSTVACVFGSVLFWLMSWGINYARVMVRSVPETQSLGRLTIALTDAAYWISPKPIDSALMVFNSLDAQQTFEKPLVFRLLESACTFSPAMSIASSAILAAMILALATYELNARDY